MRIVCTAKGRSKRAAMGSKANGAIARVGTNNANDPNVRHHEGSAAVAGTRAAGESAGKVVVWLVLAAR